MWRKGCIPCAISLSKAGPMQSGPAYLLYSLINIHPQSSYTFQSDRGAGKVSGQGGQTFVREAPKKIFRLPTVPYVTVAYPAHRSILVVWYRHRVWWDNLVWSRYEKLPTLCLNLALQLGLVIHTPGLYDYKKTVTPAACNMQTEF